jgi:hypothetical protein
MRLETAKSIGKLVVLIALAFSVRPWEARQAEKQAPCDQEDDLIDHWKSMNLIRETKRHGENLDFFVYDRKWAGLPHATQLQIGQAAYCQVALAGKGGLARIDDLKGKELAHVEGGEWHGEP